MYVIVRSHVQFVFDIKMPKGTSASYCLIFFMTDAEYRWYLTFRQIVLRNQLILSGALRHRNVRMNLIAQ